MGHHPSATLIWGLQPLSSEGEPMVGLDWPFPTKDEDLDWYDAELDDLWIDFVIDYLGLSDVIGEVQMDAVSEFPFDVYPFGDYDDADVERKIVIGLKRSEIRIDEYSIKHLEKLADFAPTDEEIKALQDMMNRLKLGYNPIGWYGAAEVY